MYIYIYIYTHIGDLFSDPGAAGLTCVKSGPVKIAADLKANKQYTYIYIYIYTDIQI